MSTESEQAAQLADEAATAIYAARRALGNASSLATEAGEMLGRARSGATELRATAEQVRTAEQPRRYVLDAQDSAGFVHQKAKVGEEILAEVRGQLEIARDQLRTGRRALDALSRIPGPETDQADDLRGRVDKLEDAVHFTGQRVTEVAGKLATARGNVEPMVIQAKDLDDLEVSSSTVSSTGTTADRNLTAAREGMADLQREFARTNPVASDAERDTIELANTMRAALNPTPNPTQNPPQNPTHQPADPEQAAFRPRPGTSRRPTNER